MENRELDAMLKQSLQPAIQAEESLDRAILERLADPSDAGGDGIGNDQAGNGMTGKDMTGKGIKGRAFQRNLPKAAAIVLAILVIGTGTVYAAGYIYNKIIVTDHGVSIGNEEYIIDEELAKPVEYAPVEEVATQEPGEGDCDRLRRRSAPPDRPRLPRSRSVSHAPRGDGCSRHGVCT